MTRLNSTRLRILGMVLEGRQRLRPPSYRDFQKALSIHPHAIQEHLLALRRDGLLTWEDGKHRTLRPLVEFIPAEAR